MKLSFDGGFDAVRIRKEFPVQRIRTVSVDQEGAVNIEFDCLDNWPTEAIMGLRRETAELLLRRLQAVLCLDD